MLEEDDASQQALREKDAEAAFLALWTLSFRDALGAIPTAEKLLEHPRVEFRYVAATHLAQLKLPQADRALARALDDEDLRVAFVALSSARDELDEPEYESERFSSEIKNGVFARLDRLFQRLPEEPRALAPLVWPWTGRETDRDLVVRYMIGAMGTRPPTCFVPFLPEVGPNVRVTITHLLGQQEAWDRQTRQTLLELAGDAATGVRGSALDALAKAQSSSKIRLTPEEVQYIREQPCSDTPRQEARRHAKSRSENAGSAKHER